MKLAQALTPNALKADKRAIADDRNSSARTPRGDRKFYVAHGHLRGCRKLYVAHGHLGGVEKFM